MKFFLDENMHFSAVGVFQDLGFKVEHAKTSGLRGAPDKEIAAYAKTNSAILITKDLEFGNMLFYPKGSHFGLLVLRLPYHFTISQVNSTLKEFLKVMNAGEMVNSITILELGRYRIRKIK